MLQTLQLKDLFFGKTDAKNELAGNTTQEKELFRNSFLIPENIDIKDFIDGKRFYISGLKGTGKTALLRYIDLHLETIPKCHSSFILFKSEFSEEDKTAFSQAANTYIALKNPDTNIDEDFSNVWQWFLHRQIVRLSKQSTNLFFRDDNNWEKYCSCVLAPKLGNEESGIFALFPKLKRGNVEIEGDVELLKGKLGLEFEWDNKEAKLVKFSQIVRQASELYKRLTPSSHKLYIFIDELELTLSKQKQYQKDIRLIRDLITAIYNINNISKQLKYDIHVISAIRSEVISAMHATGKEINKSILDFGVNLKWQQSGGNINEHPLIRIINKKIQSSEKSLGIDVSTEDEIWKKYFPEQINMKPTREFILHRTWYRPRDIVRLLNIAQQQYPNEAKFSHQVFDGINKEYSTQSWFEHAEELSAFYSADEIDGIKKMLTALKCPFTFAQISQKCDQSRKMYSSLDKLLNKYKIGDILSHLYNIGIIGNTGENIRYSFRGDDELVIENKMKIHDPLWNYLSISTR